MKRIKEIGVLILCLVVVYTGAWAAIDNQGIIAKYQTTDNGNQYQAPYSEADMAALERLITAGKTKNQVMHHIRNLHFEIAARQAKADRGRTVCEWAYSQFARFRLSNVHIEEYTHIPGSSEKSYNPESSNTIKRLWNVVSNTIHKKKPVKTYIVMADIPGTQKPDEYLLVGAYLDSDDDGTSAAITVEAARLLMATGTKPHRTIRFILFAGDEIDNIGAQTYATNHPDMMSKITAVLCMNQGSGYISGIHATSTTMDDCRYVFAPVESLSAEIPFEVKKDSNLSDLSEERSENANTINLQPFTEAGVPVFTWLQQENDSNRNKLEYSSLVIAMGTLRIANLDHMLRRTPTSSFVSQDQPYQPKIINWCYKLLMSYQQILRQVRQDSTPAVK
jgi:hypothetical protein